MAQKSLYLIYNSFTCLPKLRLYRCVDWCRNQQHKRHRERLGPQRYDRDHPATAHLIDTWYCGFWGAAWKLCSGGLWAQGGLWAEPREHSEHRRVEKGWKRKPCFVEQLIYVATSTLKSCLNVASFFHLILLPVWKSLGETPLSAFTPPKTHMKESVAFLLGRAPESPGEPSCSWRIHLKMCHHQLVEFRPTVWKGVLKCCI